MIFDWEKLAIVALLSALPALANGADTHVQKVFVPFEVYVEANREAYKEEWYLKGGCSEQHIEAMLDDAAKTGFIFSAEKVAGAFTTILDSDRLNIGCITEPMRLEFISAMSTNTVMVNTVLCDMMRSGMQCAPPIQSERHFLIDPSKTIELSDNVTFDEARRIVDWFRHDAGTQLTENEKSKARGLGWRAAVGRDGAAYTFRAGDPFCECVFSVRLEVPDRHAQSSLITLSGKPQFVCPQ